MATPARVICLCTALAALVFGPAFPGPAFFNPVFSQSDPDLSTVLSAAAAYVKDYQTKLTSIIAEETCTQQIVTQVPHDPNAPRLRRLTGEMFFMFVPNGEWMAIRDVIRVDGQPVPNRPVILDELQRLPVHDVADTFMKHNSRFNLGRTFRNFNEPTLVLHVLTDAHRPRFSFERKRVDRRGNAPLVTVAFAEAPGPTSLIRDLARGAVASAGELTIEAGSGRIHRGMLTAKVGPVSLQLITEFALDTRLEIWVPVRFRERYELGTPPSSLESYLEYEDAIGEAKYTNFRRFQTGSRIIKNPAVF
jgi:hypothetical protein